MSGSEGEMEPLDVWEGGLDFRLRIEKETKRQEHTGLYLKENTKGGKEGLEGRAEGTRGEREGKMGRGKTRFYFPFQESAVWGSQGWLRGCERAAGVLWDLSALKPGSPIAQGVKKLTLGPLHYHTIEGLDSSEPWLPLAGFEFPWKLKKKKEQGFPNR